MDECDGFTIAVGKSIIILIKKTPENYSLSYLEISASKQNMRRFADG